TLRESFSFTIDRLSLARSLTTPTTPAAYRNQPASPDARRTPLPPICDGRLPDPSPSMQSQRCLCPTVARARAGTLHARPAPANQCRATPLPGGTSHPLQLLQDHHGPCKSCCP